MKIVSRIILFLKAHLNKNTIFEPLFIKQGFHSKIIENHLPY
jgi:hypothetical protein